MFDESISLLVKTVEIELNTPRLTEQEAVQKGDCNVSIGTTIAHDIPALILIDCAIPAILRAHRCEACQKHYCGTDDKTMFY
jgi:hypothetical protein